MNYNKIELWKNRGFINENLSIDKQLELAKNLAHAKDMLNCYNVLENYNEEYYSEVECVLYPIIVHYTLIKNISNTWDIGRKFIEFCENNLRIKYFIEKYNNDYLLCVKFIEMNN